MGTTRSLSGFPLSSKTNISKLQFDQEGAAVPVEWELAAKEPLIPTPFLHRGSAVKTLITQYR